MRLAEMEKWADRLNQRMQDCIQRIRTYEPQLLSNEKKFAEHLEELRCQEVDAYYASQGVERHPERVIARRVYREDEERDDRRLAYA